MRLSAKPCYCRHCSCRQNTALWPCQTGSRPSRQAPRPPRQAPQAASAVRTVSQNVRVDKTLLMATTSCSCRHCSCRHNTAETASRIASVHTAWMRLSAKPCYCRHCSCRQNTALWPCQTGSRPSRQAPRPPRQAPQAASAVRTVSQNVRVDKTLLMATTSCSCRHCSCRHNTAETASRIASVHTAWLLSTFRCSCRQSRALVDSDSDLRTVRATFTPRKTFPLTKHGFHVGIVFKLPGKIRSLPNFRCIPVDAKSTG